MRDFLNWWLAQGSRLSALLVAFCVFLGLSIALAQANRQYHGLIQEVRAIFVKQEGTRQEQFAKMLSTLEQDFLRQERDLKARHEEHLVMQHMLSKLLDQAAKPGR
jgi:hypothetical protein